MCKAKKCDENFCGVYMGRVCISFGIRNSSHLGVLSFNSRLPRGSIVHSNICQLYNRGLPSFRPLTDFCYGTAGEMNKRTVNKEGEEWPC